MAFANTSNIGKKASVSFTLPLCFFKSSLRDSYTVKECVGGLNKGAAGYVPDSAGSG